MDAHSCAQQLYSSSIRPEAKIVIQMTSSTQISFRKKNGSMIFNEENEHVCL